MGLCKRVYTARSQGDHVPAGVLLALGWPPSDRERAIGQVLDAVRLTREHAADPIDVPAIGTGDPAHAEFYARFDTPEKPKAVQAAFAFD